MTALSEFRNGRDTHGTIESYYRPIGTYHARARWGVGRERGTKVEERERRPKFQATDFRENEPVRFELDDPGRDGHWYFTGGEGDYGPWKGTNLTVRGGNPEWENRQVVLFAGGKMLDALEGIASSGGLGRGAVFELTMYPGYGRAKEYKAKMVEAGQSPAPSQQQAAPVATAQVKQTARGKPAANGALKSRGDEFVQSKAQATGMCEWAAKLARGLGPKGGAWENEEAYQGLISTICIHAGNKVDPSEFGAPAQAAVTEPVTEPAKGPVTEDDIPF